MNTVWISPERLSYLIAEDVPYFDLTSHLLELDDVDSQIEFYSREPGLLCGSEEVAQIIEMLGAHVINFAPSGTKLKAQEIFFTAEGPASSIHAAWKVCLNIFEHYSAIATKTRHFVDLIEEVDPSIHLFTTRKSIPGIKDFSTKALLLGGALPHRLGLSETILIFEEHRTLIGGKEGLLNIIPELLNKAKEKCIFVECEAEDVMDYLEAGVNGIQLDKAKPEEAKQIIAYAKQRYSHASFVLAGGINEKNIQAYAQCGADGLVSSAVFYTKPLDMSVHINAL